MENLAVNSINSVFKILQKVVCRMALKSVLS